MLGTLGGNSRLHSVNVIALDLLGGRINSPKLRFLMGAASCYYVVWFRKAWGCIYFIQIECLSDGFGESAPSSGNARPRVPFRRRSWVSSEEISAPSREAGTSRRVLGRAA